jgi:hypothetical protein
MQGGRKKLKAYLYGVFIRIRNGATVQWCNGVTVHWDIGLGMGL